MEPQWVRVTVHPGAGKDVLVSTGPGRCEAWVRAKPINGLANDAVVALLVRYLALPRARLRLVKGARGRQKLFKVLPE
jgi:uncharacterized protein YggU (UPF0235/DUF167 family)